MSDRKRDHHGRGNKPSRLVAMMFARAGVPMVLVSRTARSVAVVEPNRAMRRRAR